MVRDGNEMPDTRYKCMDNVEWNISIHHYALSKHIPSKYLPTRLSTEPVACTVACSLRNTLAYKELALSTNQHHARRQRHPGEIPRLPNIDNTLVSSNALACALSYLARVHPSRLAVPQTMSQRSRPQERCICSPSLSTTI
jgi:hypothetical protein